MHKEI